MHTTLRLRIRAGLVAALLVPACLSLSARAHEGPPFPIVVDHEIGSLLVSVWTDPDIGIGTFFVILEPKDGTLPDAIRVHVGIAPKSGRLEEVLYEAAPQAVRSGARYFTEVEFDQGEWWDVRMRRHGVVANREGMQYTERSDLVHILFHFL